MSPSPLRVGLVGGNAERGWARDAHVPALATLPRYRVAGVSARDAATARAAAHSFGAERAFDSTLDLVRSPDIDVVAVTVKVPEHLPVVLAALEAGKHVYCEWPLGRTVTEADQMAAAADRASGCTIIGLQGLAAPAVERAEALIRSGALGRLLSARVVSPTAGWGASAPPHYAYLNERKNGATMADIAGGHTVALVERLLGRYVQLQAQEAILNPDIILTGTDLMIRRDCADHLAILGKHDSGCTSSVEIVSGRGQTPFLFELFGSRGGLRITGLCPGGYQTGVLMLEGDVDAEVAPLNLGNGLKGPAANVAETYRRLAEVIDNGSPPGQSFREAAHLTHLMASIADAARTGIRWAV